MRALESESTFDDVTDPWDHFPDEAPRDIRTNPSNGGMPVPRPTAPPPEVPFSIEPEADLPEAVEPSGHRWVALGVLFSAGAGALVAVLVALLALAAWLGVGVDGEALRAVGF